MQTIRLRAPRTERTSQPGALVRDADVRLPALEMSACVLVALCIQGCGADASAADAAVDAALCEGCPAPAFQVEVYGSGERYGPHTMSDRAVLPWRWGSQGGTMLLPRLVFEEGTVAEGERLLVTLEHHPDPDAPEAFGEAAEFPMLTQRATVQRDEEGALTVGTFDDQLSDEAIDGMRLVYVARVEAEGRESAERRYRVELETTPAAIACASFEERDEDCAWYVVPGVATVRISDPDPRSYACDTDPRRVELTFTADDPVAAEACDRSLRFDPALGRTRTFTVGAGAAPPASCLEPTGVVDGATLPAELHLMRGGGCGGAFVQLAPEITERCADECFSP